MNELKINGKQDFMGIEIPVVAGGFSKDKRCLSDKTIAKIHGGKAIHVRENINKNRIRFKTGVDVVDLKDIGTTDNNLLYELGYTKMEIAKAECIYILSERGYAKLIKIMDSDLAWEIHDKLIDEYFEMREVIDSDDILKSKYLLAIYDGGQAAIVASKELSQLEVNAATAPLLETIEEQKPKADFHDTVRSSNNSISIGTFSGVVQNNPKLKKFGRNKMFEWFRENGYLCTCGDLKNKPTQVALSGGYMDYDEYVTDNGYGKSITTYKPLITGKGQIYFTKKLLQEIEY